MTMTNAELAKRIEELAKEATPGPWKHSEQDGVPGHCFTAQLWDSNGKCLAVIEPTDDEATASSNAALITELVNNLPAIISALRGRESVIEDCARIVETTLEQMPHADYGPWARMAITLAARAVRRGRHLTAAEKLANLQRALDETDEEPQDEAALASTSQVIAEGCQEPDYVYDHTDWEETHHWEDRDYLTNDLPVGDMQEFSTLINGPSKWAAHVVVTRDEEGDPDETEIRWFDSEGAAKEALGHPVRDLFDASQSRAMIKAAGGGE